MAAEGIAPWWYGKVLLALALLGFAAWSMTRALPETLIFGQALAVAGALSNLYHYLLLKRSVGALGKPARLLAEGGLFRWIRHPMYASDLVLEAGLVLLAPGWGSLGLAAAFAAFTVQTARWEDRLLAQRFGEEFAAWCRRSGLLTPWPRG